VCTVCVRRLFSWLQALHGDALAAAAAPVWPAAGVADPPGEPEVDSARTACRESIARALPTQDPAGRVSIAISFLEMGLVPWALEALAGTDPSVATLSGYRALTSLLSRLLHPEVLAPDGREQLERVLYPEPEKRS
jgi:hypothetical protein